MEGFYHTIKFDIDKAAHKCVDSTWSKIAFPYPNHRLYYIKGGKADLILKNQKITLEKGHMYFLSAFMMVESICKEFLDHKYIHFMIDSKVNKNIFEIYNPKIEIKAKNPSETEKLFNTVISHHENPSFSTQLYVNGALSMILAPFFKETQEPIRQIKRFIPVLEYIESHIDENVSAKRLAKILNLEPVYFSNLFSNTFNIPPHQYILKKRLELALQLLANTNQNIKEIAYKVGFRNEIYFSKLFREKTQMTPSQYRKLGKIN